MKNFLHTFLSSWGCILCLFFLILHEPLTPVRAEKTSQEIFRIGIIGTDTSHVPAFVNTFNGHEETGLYKKYQITAAVKGGMPDNPDSWGRVDKIAQEISKKGVMIYPTIQEMLPHVDGVLVESVDGRCHLEMVRPVIMAGKPIYVDKPLAGSLADCAEIFRLAEEKKVPLFSASSLRYSPDAIKVREKAPVGEIHGGDAWSPCKINKTHPRFYWYGIHGVETLYTILGAGCQSVTCVSTDAADVAVGVWKNGQIGTFRALFIKKQDYGATVFGEKGIIHDVKYAGYKGLCDEICNFFETGKASVSSEETLEIFAFMSAAEESLARNGASVSVSDVLEKAKKTLSRTFKLVILADGTLTLDGEPVTREQLTEKVSVPAGVENIQHRVLLFKDPNVTHEVAQKVCELLGNAMLAAYYYNSENR